MGISRKRTPGGGTEQEPSLHVGRMEGRLVSVGGSAKRRGLEQKD